MGVLKRPGAWNTQAGFPGRKPCPPTIPKPKKEPNTQLSSRPAHAGKAPSRNTTSTANRPVLNTSGVPAVALKSLSTGRNTQPTGTGARTPTHRPADRRPNYPRFSRRVSDNRPNLAVSRRRHCLETPNPSAVPRFAILALIEIIFVISIYDGNCHLSDGHSAYISSA